MKNSLKMGISVGGPSIIMIFVVLCLTTLGTLSLVTASADLKLSQKTIDSTAAYYAADSLGEEFLAQVDAALDRDKASALIREIPDTSTSIQGDALSISHTIRISNAQKLVIGLTVPAFGGSDPKSFRIVSWRVVNNDYWHYDDFNIQFQDVIPINEQEEKQ